MRTFKILAVAATLLVATAGLALACDGNKTAKAEKADVKTASTEVATSGCSSSAAAKTASATKTAGAACSSSASAVKTAGAKGACSSSASAIKTAGAEGACTSSSLKTAEAAAGCSTSQAKLASAVKLETVRMPSGALAVFYHGKTAEAVEYLQASAEKGCDAFACTMAQKLAKNENCKTEMAATENGVMILVTSEKNEAIDEVAAQYAVAVKATSGEQGE